MIESAIPHKARQERLRALMEARRLSCFVVSKPANVFYVTGFRGSAGLAVFTPTQGRLSVDPRYALQAREQAWGVKVIEERKSLLTAVGRWLRRRKLGVIGYEDGHLTCAALRQLQEESGGKATFKPASGIVEALRQVKDAGEIGHIRAAGHLTARVLDEVRPEVRPGVRECDLAAEIEYRMRRAGAEGAAFETIVASGARTALPHARASTKAVAPRELVIIDVGAILAGYAADMTRTFYTGKPGRRVRTLFDAMLGSQQQAIDAVREGAKCGDVDSAARNWLKARSLDQYFSHSTGHGVGLEVHEIPRLGRNERTPLKAGCVVTIEPGIYIEGFGGIRIEDSLLVEAGGSEILTPSSKRTWLLE